MTNDLGALRVRPRNLRGLLLGLAILAGSSGNAAAQDVVAYCFEDGVRSGHWETWDTSCVHVISAWTKVEVGAGLTIAPNAIVEFRDGRLQIDGILYASNITIRGASSAPEIISFSPSVGFGISNLSVTTNQLPSSSRNDVAVDGSGIRLDLPPPTRIVARNRAVVTTGNPGGDVLADNATVQVQGGLLRGAIVKSRGTITAVNSVANITPRADGAPGFQVASGANLELQASDLYFLLPAQGSGGIAVQAGDLKIDNCQVRGSGSLPLISAIAASPGSGGSSLDLRGNQALVPGWEFDTPGVVVASADTTAAVEPTATLPAGGGLVPPPTDVLTASPRVTNVLSQAYTVPGSAGKLRVSFNLTNATGQLSWTFSAFGIGPAGGAYQTQGTGPSALIEAPIDSTACVGASPCQGFYRIEATRQGGSKPASRSMAYIGKFVLAPAAAYQELSLPDLRNTPTYEAGSLITVTGSAAGGFFLEAHGGVDMQPGASSEEWGTTTQLAGPRSGNLGSWDSLRPGLRPGRTYTMRLRSALPGILPAQGYFFLTDTQPPALAITVPASGSALSACMSARPTKVRGTLVEPFIRSLTARWGISNASGSVPTVWTSLTPIDVSNPATVTRVIQDLTADFPPPQPNKFVMIELTATDLDGRSTTAQSLFFDGNSSISRTTYSLNSLAEQGFVDPTRQGDRVDVSTAYATVSSKAKVTIYVVPAGGGQGSAVRTLINVPNRNTGVQYTDSWDCRSGSGTVVPDGTYEFLAEIEYTGAAAIEVCRSSSFVLDSVSPIAEIASPTADASGYYFVSNLRGNVSQEAIRGRAYDQNCSSSLTTLSTPNGTYHPGCSDSQPDRVLAADYPFHSLSIAFHSFVLSVTDRAGHRAVATLQVKRSDLVILGIAPQTVDWLATNQLSVNLRIPTSLESSLVEFYDFSDSERAEVRSSVLFSEEVPPGQIFIERSVMWDGFGVPAQATRVPDSVYACSVSPVEPGRPPGPRILLPLMVGTASYFQDGIENRDFFPSEGQYLEVQHTFDRPSYVAFLMTDSTLLLCLQGDPLCGPAGDPWTGRGLYKIPVTREFVPGTATRPVERKYSWDGTIRPGSRWYSALSDGTHPEVPADVVGQLYRPFTIPGSGSERYLAAPYGSGLFPVLYVLPFLEGFVMTQNAAGIQRPELTQIQLSPATYRLGEPTPGDDSLRPVFASFDLVGGIPPGQTATVFLDVIDPTLPPGNGGDIQLPQTLFQSVQTFDSAASNPLVLRWTGLRNDPDGSHFAAVNSAGSGSQPVGEFLLFRIRVRMSDGVREMDSLYSYATLAIKY